MIRAFAVEDFDWQTDPTLRSVDGRSLHEIVVSTMMPATPQESVTKSFVADVAHLAEAGASLGTGHQRAKWPKLQRTARKSAKPTNDGPDSDELLAQLSSSAAPVLPRRNVSAKRPRVAASFNPFANGAIHQIPG